MLRKQYSPFCCLREHGRDELTASPALSSVLGLLMERVSWFLVRGRTTIHPSRFSVQDDRLSRGAVDMNDGMPGTKIYDVLSSRKRTKIDT